MPHKVQNVFEYLEGNYPRLRLYLNSPAAQALAAAEQTFPLIKGSNETDARPLMDAISLPFRLEPPAPQPLKQLSLGLLSLAAAGLALAVLWSARLPRKLPGRV